MKYKPYFTTHKFPITGSFRWSESFDILNPVPYNKLYSVTKSETSELVIPESELKKHLFVTRFNAFKGESKIFNNLGPSKVAKPKLRSVNRTVYSPRFKYVCLRFKTTLFKRGFFYRKNISNSYNSQRFMTIYTKKVGGVFRRSLWDRKEYRRNSIKTTLTLNEFTRRLRLVPRIAIAPRLVSQN